MDYLTAAFRKPVFRRILIFSLIALVLYLLRSMMTLLLLTFVFIYIFNSVQSLISRFLGRFIRINRMIVISFVYLVFLALFAVAARIYIPVIITQTKWLIIWLTEYIENFSGSQTPDNLFTRILYYISNNADISKYIGTGGSALLGLLTNIGTLSLYILLSLILSLFFMIEKTKIADFMRRFKNSAIWWMYDDIRYFFMKFTNSFGKVIQTQILISFINAMLTLLILTILRFPSIVGLTVMVFVLGLVPVAGVFISLIPLSIIAYNGGGITRVVYVLVLIAVLHALESYILNPKFMSQRVKLPVFFTFLILLVSEHFLGVWGLIVGLPVAMFILDMLEVTDGDNGARKKTRASGPPAA